MERRRHRARALGLLPALVLAAAMSACGSAPTASPTKSVSPSSPTTPVAPATPACGDVWKAGKAFPAEYHGCLAQGKKVAARPTVCETGQYLYRYQDHFYATPGAPIRHTDGSLQRDPQFRHTWRACTA